MDYKRCEPLLPTFSRWRTLEKNYGRASVLRALQYEALVARPPAGRVLDIGGGRKAKYLKHLPPDIELESINIDTKIDPTYLVGPGDTFPVASSTYDSAICLNTLEHIYDPCFVLGEIHRVLKPGGVALITVPFIFRIHAHPDDYFRATPSWWRESISRAGFGKLELTPLIWGRATAAGLIAGHHGILPGVSRRIEYLKDIAYARLFFKGDHYDGARGQRIVAVSSGWFMVATK